MVGFEQRGVLFSMAQLSFANRRGRGVNSSGNGVRMYTEANDLRERAKSRNAYVYRFLTNDKDHHDEVLRLVEPSAIGLLGVFQVASSMILSSRSTGGPRRGRGGMQ